MQDSLVVEEGRLVNLLLVPLPLFPFPYRSCFKDLSLNKKFNNHIVKMHKEPTSFIL